MPEKYENMAFKTCWQMCVIPYRIEIYIQSTEIGRRELFELGPSFFFNQLQKRKNFYLCFFFFFGPKLEHEMRTFMALFSIGWHTNSTMEFAASEKKIVSKSFCPLSNIRTSNSEKRILRHKNPHIFPFFFLIF